MLDLLEPINNVIRMPSMTTWLTPSEPVIKRIHTVYIWWFFCIWIWKTIDRKKHQQFYFLLYGWLCKWARWSKPCVLIGYLSGQEGTYLACSGFPALFPQPWCNKPFFDQAYLFFFCVFMDLDFISVHKIAKKEGGQYPPILTSCLVNNTYIYIAEVCISCFWEIHWRASSITFEAGVNQSS